MENLIYTKTDKVGTRFALLDEGQPQDVREGLTRLLLNVAENQSIALIRPLVKGDQK